jgi:hypothetical protein
MTSTSLETQPGEAGTVPGSIASTFPTSSRSQAIESGLRRRSAES